MSGHGVFESSRLGYKYEGNWEKNMKNGDGVEELSDGTKIKCHFENDARQGTIIMEKSDGTSIEGREIYGKLSPQ